MLRFVPQVRLCARLLCGVEACASCAPVRTVVWFALSGPVAARLGKPMWLCLRDCSPTRRLCVAVPCSAGNVPAGWAGLVVSRGLCLHGECRCAAVSAPVCTRAIVARWVAPCGAGPLVGLCFTVVLLAWLHVVGS